MQPVSAQSGTWRKVENLRPLHAGAWRAQFLWGASCGWALEDPPECGEGGSKKERGKPSRMTLGWLEAENGNASEDSIKIKTEGKRKTLNSLLQSERNMQQKIKEHDRQTCAHALFLYKALLGT